MCREAVAALSVLALIFLSFSQAPLSNDGDTVAREFPQIAVVSFCGDGAAGDAHGVHGPCHACRVSLAALPAPPSDAEPAFAAFAVLDFAHANDIAPPLFQRDGYSSRAPPVAV